MERFGEARELIAALEKRGFLEPEAEQLKAAVDLQASGATDMDTRWRVAEANPTDFAAQLSTPRRWPGRSNTSRHWTLHCRWSNWIGQDWEAARQLMVNVFRVLPGESELVQQYRRKLAMLLF